MDSSFCKPKILSILDMLYECEMKQNVLRFGRKFFMYLDESGLACNGTDLLVRQYLSKQSAHLAENLNQVASYSRLLIVKGGSMKI